MSTATINRNAAQRVICLFFSFVIVSATLGLGAMGVESMVRNAQSQQTALVAQA